MNSELLERSILGTMLDNNYLIKDGLLTVQHFNTTIHKAIYKAMKKLIDNGQSVDEITLISDGSNAQVFGDINYIMSLKEYENLGKFDIYVDLLIQSYQQRKMRNVLQVALSEDWELEKTINELNKIEFNRENDAKTAYEMATEICNLPFEEAVSRRGIMTGFKKLDLSTGGLVNGELSIIAARPSLGKTDLMINLAISSQIKNENVLTLFFSLEMSNKSVSERFACNLGNINRNCLKDPSTFTEGKKEDWVNAMGIYSEMDIISFDKPAQTITEIRSKIRKAVSEYSEKQVVVFIDYLTLITPGDKNANTHVQVGDISKDLKTMAREFDIPVICLAQLNRKVEERKEKRPMLADLRESGSIEQDADIVLLLYRDSYYDDNQNNDTRLELHIAKNRSGCTGTIYLDYYRSTGMIKDGNY